TGPVNALPGQTVFYTIVVSNAGPSTANDVLLSDPTPAGLGFVSNTGDCMTTFPCELGTIAPSGSATLVATYTVLPGVTRVVNTATVSSSTPDPDSSDDTGSATTTVGPGPPPPPPTDADLEVGKTGTPTTAASDPLVTYTLTAVNPGPAAATNGGVSDAGAGGVQLVSATASPGACAGSNPVTCTVATLSSGQMLTATIVVRVLPSASGTLVDTATASSDQSDPDPTNN